MSESCVRTLEEHGVGLLSYAWMCFFFSSRRRHTRCALVTWSSDVCSSDLLAMTAEDFRFETMARAPDWMLYKWDRYQFAAARAAMSRVMKAPIQLSIAGMIGEGDDVDVEAENDREMRSEERRVGQ